MLRFGAPAKDAVRVAKEDLQESRQLS
jgi:hypothetical protein